MELMLVAACGMVWFLHIVQLLRRRGRSYKPALAIALLGVAATALAWRTLPAHAGTVGMATVALLLIVPTLATRGASRALKWGHIGRARVMARLASVLRPLAAVRQFRKSVEVSWRLNRGEKLDLDSAIDTFGTMSPTERDANALAFLSWTSDFAAMNQRLMRPGVEGVALRAGLNAIATATIGETHDHETLLRWYQRLARSGALDRKQLDATWALLLCAAYLGDVALVRRHLDDVRDDVPPARLAFVVATALQRAGAPHDAVGTVQAALRQPLLHSAEQRLRYRLNHPLAPLPQDLTVRQTLQDIAQRLETRRMLSALSLQWRKPSPVTWALGLSVAAAFAWQLAQASQDAVFSQWGLAAPFSAAPDLYRLLSYGWLHLDIVHFGVNLLGLLFFGRYVERNYGKLKFSIIYLVGALGGGAAYLLFETTRSVAIGASGAVMALFGATVAHIASQPALRNSRQGRRELIFLSIVAVVQLGVDSLWELTAGSAHAGGMLVGALLGWLLSRIHTTMQVPPRRGSPAPRS